MAQKKIDPYKKFIKDIVKELKDDSLIFNEDTLNYILEDFEDRIFHYEIDVDCMEEERTPGWQGARKTLRRWKSLFQKAKNFLHPKSKAIEQLSEQAQKLGLKLVPSNESK